MKKIVAFLLCLLVVGSALEARRGSRKHRRGHIGTRHGRWRHAKWHRGHRRHRKYHHRPYWRRRYRGWNWWGPRIWFGTAPSAYRPALVDEFIAQFGYTPTVNQFCDWVGWGARACRLYRAYRY